MKIHSTVSAIALALVGAGAVSAQGTFMNLDFEMAEIGQFPVGFSNALPHWRGFAAGEAVSTVIYNGVLLDSPRIGIWDANADPRYGITRPPLFGAYSAYLMADAGNLWPSPDAELAQTGTVPATARSVRFATTPDSLGFNPDLRPEYWQLYLLLDGQSVSYLRVETHADFILWGADVTAYAGQTMELRFRLHTAYPPVFPPPFDVGVAIGLDNIFFSPEPVPEPSALALCLGGGALWLAARGRRRNGWAVKRTVPRAV